MLSEGLCEGCDAPVWMDSGWKEPLQRCFKGSREGAISPPFTHTLCYYQLTPTAATTPLRIIQSLTPHFNIVTQTTIGAGFAPKEKIQFVCGPISSLPLYLLLPGFCPVWQYVRALPPNLQNLWPGLHPFRLPQVFICFGKVGCHNTEAKSVFAWIVTFWKCLPQNRNALNLRNKIFPSNHRD